MPSKVVDLSDIGTLTMYKRKTNRSLRLTVNGSGDIRLTMPLWTPYRTGLAFALSKRDWILAQNRSAPIALSDGLQIGKSHHLIFRYDPALTAIKTQVRSTEIVVSYGADHTISDAPVQLAARAACWRALRAQATSLLAQRVTQLAARHGLVDYQGPAIKRMKSRWGSCDQNKRIVLNLFLIQLPWELIDYVILHELTHTIVLHHGPDFWSQLEVFLPNARQLRKAIKPYRPALYLA